MMLDRGAYPYYLYNRVSNQNNGKVGFVAMVDFYNYPNPSWDSSYPRNDRTFDACMVINKVTTQR